MEQNGLGRLRADQVGSLLRPASLKEAFAGRGVELHAVSAATGEGVAPLRERLWAEVAKARAARTT